MSDREESPDRQENGSHQSNDDRGRRSHSPRVSRSAKRHSRSSPRERRSPYESHGYSGRGRQDRGYEARYPQERNYRGGRGSRDRRSHSRSPMSSRRRHQGNRDNPPAGRCLGIFGLSIYTQERDLNEVFGKFGPIDDVQIVYDAQTGRSRGFSFVYFKNVEDAQMAKERCNGIDIDGRKIRVDFSITQRAHTPTPGIYMGKPTEPTKKSPRYRGSRPADRAGDRNDYYSAGGPSGGVPHAPRNDAYYRERSPSPYYRDSRRRYSRSRSRSYSPRYKIMKEERITTD